MRAVILAAGEGKRLRPLTSSIPKPLLKVKGKPILEHTFRNLPDFINEIILIIGYRGNQIKKYFGSEFGGKKIIYIKQPEPLGTFHALSCAKRYLNGEPFLVLVGDDFYKKEDLEKLAGYPVSALAKETDIPERFGICKTGASGYLEDIVEKPDYPCGNLASTGAFVLTPHIFAEQIIYGPNQEQLLAPMVGSLAKKMRIKIVNASFWFPIGYPEDLIKAGDLV
ncbi:MAG: nucleotidyltransferase family protein [Candidatus Harrisonbacteria bacterium]|nr:nucleotidyltransferase family protein [Candidatus Harrisonbacteria bacterium]